MGLFARSIPPDVHVVRQGKAGTEADFGEIRAFLGQGIQFKGEVKFAGAVRIDGHLEGELVCGEVLIIGEGAQVKAEIEVRSLEVSGQVEGNITARQRVELLGASRVTGKIRTPCLVVVEGAVFNGKCEMLSPKESKVEGL